MMIPQTLSQQLAALAARETPPPWHELQPLIAVAARHTEHVQGCTACGAWTECPDDLGRCDACAVACAGCAKALEDADEGVTTAGGDLLCVDCYADRGPHPRACRCDRCQAQAEDAADERRIEMGIRRREARGWPTGGEWTP